MAQTASAPVGASEKSDQSAVTVGDVVVTARRREEAVRDVPTTITALGVDQLAAKGPIEGVGDLLQIVPGARFNSLQSENLAEVSIRGSGTQRATSADSGVGLFVNGAYVGSSTLGGRNFKRIDYFDIARIEALEGPQGALYGRNSEFGTVNIVLAQPTFNNSGRVSATYIDDLKQMQMEGVVNQKINDTTAVRLSAQVTGQGGGLYYNPNQNKYYDHTDGYIARGQIRHADGPLDINLMFDAMDMNLPTFANQWVIPAGRLATLPQGYTSDRYVLPQDVKNDLHQIERRTMLIANYDFGWATLTSTSMVSFSRSVQNFASNVDLATEASFQSRGWIGLYPLGMTTTNSKDQTLYQDLHLAGDLHDGALQWLTGVEFLAQDDLYVRDVVTSPCTLTATSGICGGTPTQPICYRLTPTAANCPATIVAAYGSHRVSPSEYRSAAVYGSLKYDIGRWSLSGELRYSSDKKKNTQTDYRLYTATQAGASSSYKFDASTPSYAATVAYHVNDSTLAYAKTGTGYRAGGVNNGSTIAVAPNPLKPTYDNEDTTSYEVGIKSTVARTVFLRLSTYISRTTDAITLVADGCTVLNACLQAGQNFNVNAGTVEVKGVEGAVDGAFKVGRGRLLVGLNVANQDAEYIKVPTGIAGLPILGSSVAQTPQWTMSANLNYRQPIVAGVSGFVNVVYNGSRGGNQDTVTATAPLIPLEDVDNVDLRFGADFNRMQVAVFVKNLTDEVIPVLKLQSGDIPLANRYSRPRTFGATVTYRW